MSRWTLDFRVSSLYCIYIYILAAVLLGREGIQKGPAIWEGPVQFFCGTHEHVLSTGVRMGICLWSIPKRDAKSLHLHALLPVELHTFLSTFEKRKGVGLGVLVGGYKEIVTQL